VTFEAGTRLGPYEIVALIGRGGMGQVYEARDTRLNRTVAIKVLSPGVSADPDQRVRLAREARAISILNHPSICTLFDIGTDEGVDFLVMELVEGPTLSEKLSAGPLPQADVITIALRLADALVQAHARGVIHRDLKPGNIKLTATGGVKVLDFGLARTVAPIDDRLSTKTLRETAVVSGTLPYMAPEQLRGEPVDERTDVYGLGAVLYEMATGVRPFPERQPVKLMDAILHDPPPAPSQAAPGVAAALDRIVLKCLEKNPDDRYRSVSELARDLAALHGSLAVARGVVVRWVRARPWKRYAAAVLVLAALVPAYRLTRRLVRPVDRRPPSVAVLPFEDMSPGHDQSYFADGVAEEVLNALTRVPGLRVTGRTSSFQFRGHPEDLREIGRKLDAASILEGSVRMEGRRVRVTAQLIDAGDGFHLWSDSYDRELTDIFAVQDDIARAVAGALQVALIDSRQPTSNVHNPGAYQAYLLGRFFYRRQSKENLEKALEYFERAVTLEPAFAAAWQGVASVRAYQAGLGYVPSDEGYARARADVKRALDLDGQLGSAHALLGWIQMSHDWDWEGAESSFERARSLQPGLGAGLVEGAQLALSLGRVEQARELAGRAVELDPLSTQPHFTQGLVAYFSGHADEARGAFRRLLELQPEVTNAHGLLAQIALLESRPDEAMKEIQLERDPYWRLPGLALVHHARGKRAASDEALNEFIRNYQEVGAYQVAQVYAFRGERDRAFEWLDRAFTQHDGGLFLVRADPLFRTLVGDSRRAALLSRLRLPADPADSHRSPPR